jgi:hypothetical protein
MSHGDDHRGESILFILREACKHLPVHPKSKMDYSALVESVEVRRAKMDSITVQANLSDDRQTLKPTLKMVRYKNTTHHVDF